MSPPATRTSRGFSRQERWDQLLAAAAEAFLRSGYQSTSMADIAARVQMRKASLYHYISSKEDLLYELELRAHRINMQVIEETHCDGERDPADELADFISRRINASTHGAETYVRVGAQELQHLSDTRRIEIRDMRETVLNHVTEVVARGQRDGTFRRDARAKVVANALLGLLSSPSARPKTGSRSPSVARACTTFFLRGLMSGAAEAPDQPSR